MNTGRQGTISINVLTKVTSCVYCEEFYASARIYARFCHVFAQPPLLQGGVVRVRAPRQAQVLLPSIRREVETNVSIS
jgi:hypothetical protein